MAAPSEQPRSPAVLPTIPGSLAAVVRAGVKANREVPGAVALGGTVCAMYAQHRLSLDIDFVVVDLRERFQQVREHLIEVPGWTEAGARPPVLLLGSIDGIQVGFRQLRRQTPMATVVVSTPDGPLTVPTLEEMLRTKAYLLYSRNATRDFVDFAALSRLVPDVESVEALLPLDAVFAWDKQPSVLLGVIKALMRTEPSDLDARGFDTLRWLLPQHGSWDQVQERCRAIGDLLARRAVGGAP